MGQRLYFYKKYIAIPSDYSIGNWNSDILNRLLYDLVHIVGEECWFETETVSGAKRIEIDKNVVEKVIVYLMTFDSWEEADLEGYDFTELPQISDLCTFMKAALTESEQNINTIHFEWI